MPDRQGDKMSFSTADRKSLVYAVNLLESEGFLIRLTAVLGGPIETGLKKLPEKARRAISAATESALKKAVNLAARTTYDSKQQPSWDRSHKALAMLAGGVGGFFGGVGALIEIPFTTVLMLRSILDIARSEGQDIGKTSSRIECVNVFAFGGPSRDDDAAETSYYATRAGLSVVAQRAAIFLASKPGQKQAAELSAKLTAYLAKIAGRYAPVVGEKFAVESLPVLGAAGGAVINAAFADHFQDKARGHFIVLRLEQKYGEKPIREEYEKIHQSQMRF